MNSSPAMKSLVSIVIPAFNAADLIREALASVAQQTYPNWEVVIVEDGTQDGTEAIATEFAAQVGAEKVRYLRHEVNQGLSATRNTAIAAARGEYIALLDHDDRWYPHHLATALATLEAQQADLVYSPAEMFEDGSDRILGICGPNAADLRWFPGSLLNKNFIPVCSVVMRKQVNETVGGFDRTLRRVEDLDYWLRVIEAGFTIAYTGEMTCSYRQRNPSAMTANKPEILEWHALVLRKHRSFRAIPHTLRDCILARYHFGVARRSWKQHPTKAMEFFFWSWRISPGGSLAAIAWFCQELLGLTSRYGW